MSFIIKVNGRFYGPFDTKEEARHYAQVSYDDNYSIFDITKESHPCKMESCNQMMDLVTCYNCKEKFCLYHVVQTQVCQICNKK